MAMRKKTPSLAIVENVSVNIKKVQNGYIVSKWSDKGEKTFIAKTANEAKIYSEKLLKK